MKSEEIKLIKEENQIIKEKVRKPLSHSEKLKLVKELIDDWFPKNVDHMTANDVYQWAKFGFVCGA